MIIKKHRIIKWFYKPETPDYHPVSKATYLDYFGITKKALTPDNEKDVDINKVKLAYERACANRDFEIDKFWSRAAYFWGFIVVIFTGYISILTSDVLANGDFKEKGVFLQLCFICLGILFSCAWYFVIVGSKHWQENWEQHINCLEENITGPLYKVIFYKHRFYSVSKINLLLSLVVIFFWLGLLAHHLGQVGSIDWMTGVVLILTLVFFVMIRWGYASKRYIEVGEGGVFIEWREAKSENNLEQ